MDERNTIQLIFWTKFKALPEAFKTDVDLVNAMRHYDHSVNINWVMHHYDAAAKYLDSGKVNVEATGGSDWHKYMHPRYQRRIFFPDLWSKEELENWGLDNLEGCKVLEKYKKGKNHSVMGVFFCLILLYFFKYIIIFNTLTVRNYSKQLIIYILAFVNVIRY